MYSRFGPIGIGAGDGRRATVCQKPGIGRSSEVLHRRRVEGRIDLRRELLSRRTYSASMGTFSGAGRVSDAAI